jgi:hypothetical protein
MRVSLEYLRYHWGDAYTIASENGKWTAVARFCDHAVLTAGSAEELQRMMWRHYPGLSADRAST